MNVKYIIGLMRVRGQEKPVEVAVVFPEILVHADVAEVFRHHVVAAGFAYLSPHTRCYVAHGRSESLDIASRPLDSDILNRQMGLIP